MEELLAQQKITNSRLLRLENKNLDLKQVLISIFESSKSIGSILNSLNDLTNNINADTKSFTNQLDILIADSEYSLDTTDELNKTQKEQKQSVDSIDKNISNLNRTQESEKESIDSIDQNISELTTNYIENVSQFLPSGDLTQIGEDSQSTIRDEVETSEEEKETIARENKVIELLEDIKELLSVKPSIKPEELEKTEEKKEDDSLFGDIDFDLPDVDLPDVDLPDGSRRGRKGRKSRRIPSGRTPDAPDAPRPRPTGRAPDAPRPRPTGRTPDAPDAPDAPKPAPEIKKSPSKLGRLGRFLAPTAVIGLGAGAMEGISDYQKTGEWDKGMFGFAGGAVEALSMGTIESESVKTGLQNMQSGLTDKLESIFLSTEKTAETLEGDLKPIQNLQADEKLKSLTGMSTTDVRKEENLLATPAVDMKNAPKVDPNEFEFVLIGTKDATKVDNVIPMFKSFDGASNITSAGRLEQSTIAGTGVNVSAPTIINNYTTNNGGSTNLSVSGSGSAGNNVKPGFQ